MTGLLRRRITDVALLTVALLAGGVAAAELRLPWTRLPAGAWMWALLVASGMAGGVALARIGVWLPEEIPPARPAAPDFRRPRVIGAVLLGAAGVLTAWTVCRLWPDYHAWHGTVLPWVAALALTAAAGFTLGSTGPGASQTGSETPEIPRWLEVTGFLAIAAAALFVRVYRIGEIPAGIYVDETNGGLDALYILEGRDDSPFGTGWYGTPNGYLYCMAAVFKVIGATWAGLKFASLLPAFLTVLAIYPLGRLMFGPVGGLSAMAFLAFNRWHMSMSRWGWNEVVPPLFQILATFFLLRGLRDRRSSDFVLGGLVSGLMMYTYLSSRLALATLGLFAVYFLLVDKGGPLAAWRRHWRGLALFVLSWAIATAPIAVTHITDSFTFTNRVQEISIFRDTAAAGNLDLLWRNVADHLKFFHQIGDHQGKHNLPDEPHADPLVGLLFLMGLGLAMLRLRDPRRGLLWLWLLLGMAGGVFSSNHESPQSYRTLTAVPAVALLAGDVLSRIARIPPWLSAAAAAAGATRRRRAAIAGGTIVLAAWAFTAAWETGVYFGPQASSPMVKGGFNPTENGVANDVLGALKRGERVLVSPRFHEYSPLRFLVYGVLKRETGRNTLDDPPYGQIRLEQDLPVPDLGRDTLLLIDIYYKPMLDYLRHFYPDAHVEAVPGPEGGEIYLRVHLGRADLAATTGVIARVTLRDGQSEERAVPEPSTTIVPPAASAVEWTGSLWVETAGKYDFVLSRDLILTLDGNPWRNARFLASGIHPFALALADPGKLPTMRLEWITPAGFRGPVPARLLFRIQPREEGLTGMYYANPEWRGTPLFARLTPMLLLAWIGSDPIPGVNTFSARFVGSLRVTTPGAYRFRLDADDGGRLYLDGKLVGECRINQLDTFPATVRLADGDHPIQVDYYQLEGGSALGLFWQPPGEPEELVPPAALIPAKK